jgi:uncharacterized protein (TIGR02996 family)
VKPGAALASLLERWRARRSPELADAIDRVAAIAGSGRARIENHQHWSAVLGADDPADLDRLLAALTDGVCNEARVRLTLLTIHHDDPRLAMALARLCDAPIFTSDANQAFWTPIPPLLTKLGDVRVLPLVEKVLAPSSGGTGFDRWLVAKLRDVKKQLRARSPVALSDSERAELAALLAEVDRSPEATAYAAGKRSADELLTAIWAAPDDDDAREVYADWLTQKGDPRGEFISLQMARHRGEINAVGKKREKELLKKHRKEWHAPLTLLLPAPAESRFERGFLCSVLINVPASAASEGIEDHAAWSTIREFRMQPNTPRAKKLFDRLVKQGAVRKPYTEAGKFEHGIG